LFLACIYGQGVGSGGLRELVASLESSGAQLYHAGLKQVPRSTLADALERHDWRIFEDTYYTLVGKAQKLVRGKRGEFDSPLKIIDSTTIGLCLSLFDWAKFRTTKGGVKIHTKLDADGFYPEQAIVTNACVSDVKMLGELACDKWTIYAFDRAYLEYKSLYAIELNESYFVTRFKKNSRYFVRKYLSRSDSGAVRADAVIYMQGKKTKRDYPKALRLVRYHDEKSGRIFEFVTNNFALSAQQIADIYKNRWQVELFFKWLKQNLKIKSFWGTSENAVFTQIFTALILAVLLWIHRALMTADVSARYLLQRIKTAILSKTSVAALAAPPPKPFKKQDVLPLFQT
jgi:hypothetical protein